MLIFDFFGNQSSNFSLIKFSDNGRIVQKLHPKRKFLHIAMMSADKFVPTRVQAAIQTWASSLNTWNHNSNVDVEIFAQSNDSVEIPIVKMPGISDNVYPPQKVKTGSSKIGQTDAFF